MDGHGGSWLSQRFIEFIQSTGLTYVWLLLLAVWGGTASYLGRLRKQNLPFSIAELLGEWVISGFAGVITAYLCLWAGFDYMVTFAMAGVAGHMGGRAIALIEQGVVGWFKTKWPWGKVNEDKPQ